MKRYILSVDQGTSSSKAIVFDDAGHPVYSCGREFTQLFPRQGWVEQNPLEILSSVRAVMNEAVSEVRDGEIAAMGIANQRETTIVWDAASGRPICNAIVWQDRRTAAFCDSLKEKGLTDMIRSRTGLIIDAYFSATKIRWILDNVPGAKAKAAAGRLRFGTVDSWLVWNLTSGRVHATDVTNASRTMLFNINTLTWDEELLGLFGIPLSMMPEVRDSAAAFGEATVLGHGIPITGVIGDQQSALFGQMCIDEGAVKNTYGTGCFLLMNTGEKRVHSENNLLTGVAWSINGKTTYSIEGSAFNAGSVIKWLRDELHMVDTAPRVDELAESVENANGMFLVPAFTGLGAPYWDMYARGTIVGLTRGVNRAHFCRAVLESICFQMTDLLRAMTKDSNIILSELRVDGGASVSNIMMQIQADLIRTVVNRPKTVETTALGAAYLAGLCVGMWKTPEEIEKNREVEKVFIPKMDKKVRDKLCEDWKRAVERSLKWAQDDDFD